MVKRTIFCPVCKRTIDKPIEQVGKPQYPPICMECHLNGLDWAVEDEKILDLLFRGYSLEVAIDAYHYNLVLEKSNYELKPIKPEWRNISYDRFHRVATPIY